METSSVRQGGKRRLWLKNNVGKRPTPRQAGEVLSFLLIYNHNITLRARALVKGKELEKLNRNRALTPRVAGCRKMATLPP